jgi:hypothetical protein
MPGPALARRIASEPAAVDASLVSAVVVARDFPLRPRGRALRSRVRALLRAEKSSLHAMFVLVMFERMYYVGIVPSSEGRFREGVRAVGRDAVLAGGSRNPAPERPPEQRCWGIGPIIAGHRQTRKRTDTAVARREARTHPRQMRLNKSGANRTNPGNRGPISARHPPRFGGRKKRGRRANPRAQAKQQGPISHARFSDKETACRY